MPKTPSRVQTVRMNIEIPPLERTYAEARAEHVGHVQDALVEAVSDTVTLFEAPVDQFRVLDAEREGLHLRPREYLRNVLARRAARLLRERREAPPPPKSSASSARSGQPVQYLESKRTTIALPVRLIHYVGERANELGTQQDAILEAVRDAASYFGVTPEQKEALEAERHSLEAEYGRALLVRDYIRFVLSQHYLALVQKERAPGSSRG